MREQTFDEKARSESDFFNYVSTAYRHFLSGNDEECAAVDEAQTRVFHDRAEATRTRNADLQQVPCFAKGVSYLRSQMAMPCMSHTVYPTYLPFEKALSFWDE